MGQKKTMRTVDAGGAVSDSDLFLTRQGTDTEDTSVTASQTKLYTLTDVEYIDFNLTPSASGQEGRLMWDADGGVPVVGLPGGNVNLNIGLEQLVPRQCRNESGVDIDNGDLVFLSDYIGNNPYIELANADSADTSKVIGMATEDIPDGDRGYVTTYGIVREVNTSGYTANDLLYLDTTDGQYTNIKPSQPNYAIQIGRIWRVHAEEGEILIGIDQRTNNAENIRGLTPGQLVFANIYGFLTDSVTSRYTTTQTLDSDDHVVFCDTDGGGFTVTLPASPGDGQYYRIINCGSGANILTINGNGNNVKGAATQYLADGEDLEMMYNATEGWW